MKKRWSASSRKKSYRSPPTSRAGSSIAYRSKRRLARKGGRRARQGAHLDPARGLQLAGQPRRRLPLLLHLPAQRATLRLGLGEGDHEHHGEQQGEGHGGDGDVQEDAHPQIEEQPEPRHRRDQDGEQSHRRAGRQPRHQPDEEQSADQQPADLDPPDEPRTREQRSLHDVLEQLGVDLDARHVIAHRRRQMIRQAERGHADEHQATLEEARIRLAREHVGRRHEAIGIVPGVVDPGAAVRVAGSHEGAHPHRLDAARRRRAPRSGARLPATRSISRPSDGTSRAGRPWPAGGRGGPPHAPGPRWSGRGRARHGRSHPRCAARPRSDGGRARDRRRSSAPARDGPRSSPPARGSRGRRCRAPPVARASPRPAPCRSRATARAAAPCRRPMPATISGSRAGERRSGSAMRMARPMAAGRAAATVPTIRASQVRGHGHCPCCRRLSSSMATMTTGAVRGTRGWRLW